MLKVLFPALLTLFISLSCPLAEGQQSIHHARIGYLTLGFPPPDSAPLDDNFQGFPRRFT